MVATVQSLAKFQEPMPGADEDVDAVLQTWCFGLRALPGSAGSVLVGRLSVQPELASHGQAGRESTKPASSKDFWCRFE